MSKSIKRREMLLGAAAVVGGGLGVTGLTSQPEKKNSTEIILTQHTSKDELEKPGKAREEVTTESPSDGIGNGEQPFYRDEKRWAKIVKRFYELYMPIRVEGKDDPDPSLFLDGPLDPNLLSLESRFIFKSEEIDEELQGFQVELLLSDAADLLGRAMTHRTRWQERAVKATSLRLEILEYLINDAIHQDEIEAGIYTLPYKRSVAESNSLAAQIKGSHDVSTLIESVLDKNFSLDAMNKQSGNHQLLALLPYFPSHEEPYVNKALNITWNSQPGKFAEHAKNAAFDQSFYDMCNKRYALYTKKYKNDTERNVAKEKKEASNKQKEWSQKDIEFKRRRAQAAREIGDLKVRLATESGGSLNYVDQMDQICLQFERDFRHALARIKKAYEGLMLIYGYKTELPESLARQLHIAHVPKTGQQASLSQLDEASGWVSDALQWLDNASLLDQNYTFSISIRQTIGDKKWLEGRKVGQWKFEILESAFPDQKNVRLRGISAYISGSRDNGVWMTRIDLPKISFSCHKQGRVVDLDQTSIPPIRIGRISIRSRTNRPEISGAALIHNASPFGKWEVFLNEKSTAGNVLDTEEDIELVDDFVLDLDVAVKS
ncbi:MAG: hypothetical protein D8M57_15400 [Candidatus Scalindua sp. AMX11]|nr:MAG: hypothetical protein DWQ00_02250 [Candidatus Scalindua sp.]NOG84035.1 hypothetical protein [Planctomycetota bacterium]RZV88102.1 MAG: hypothetical protein EX341_07280 [Candidatus Scalindua sp. SCAELEC01]TDE64036.1 MAG: hypothetical protein D8M57_15400 [Candidatus Scalindua sp. AMX11]GJQ60906.1 MAG: hypothetical protein SCALA701_37070 [Candidatus Scalindua sp.]